MYIYQEMAFTIQDVLAFPLKHKLKSRQQASMFTIQVVSVSVQDESRNTENYVELVKEMM